MKQKINMSFFLYWFSKVFMLSVILSAVFSAIIAVLLGGIWLEFADEHSAVYLNSFSLFINDNAVLTSTIATNEGINPNNILVILSSLDTKVLHTVFVLMNIAQIGSLIGCLYLLITRNRVLYAACIVFVLTLIFIFNINKMPSSLDNIFDSSYLMLVTAMWFISVFCYVNLKQCIRGLPNNTSAKTLIAYASQSGTAKNVALNMAKSSRLNCDIEPFSQLTPDGLFAYEKLFVVASTYGDGQAPEKSMGFFQALNNCQNQFSHLHYAVLALGDSTYPKFCAFGHQISELLSHKGANLIQPVQEIDRADETIINTWWMQICNIFGWYNQVLATQWVNGKVVKNTCLNPYKNNKRPAHAITLNTDNLTYCAGDLLEVITPNSLENIHKKLAELGLEPTQQVELNGVYGQLDQTLTHLEWGVQKASDAQTLVNNLPLLRPRIYSIASVPNPINAERNANNNHDILLFVRKLLKDDGSLGYSSSALCNACINDTFKIAVRKHDSFRLPSDKNIPIIMIGAGTGIAPFMSFLAQKQQEAGGETWLIFGEQYSQHDHYFNQELEQYLNSGVLNRLDNAFSRDEAWLTAQTPRYVDEVIYEQQSLLIHWLCNNGAHLYVCGNKAGVGESVKTALKKILKQDYNLLQKNGSLHFDLY